MADKYDGSERRKFTRIYKNYILSFNEAGGSKEKIEVSQIINVSRGGLCFVATKPLAPGTTLDVQLKTPYLASALPLEGMVLESREKIAEMIFEIRMIFKNLTPQAEEVLLKIEQYNQKGD